MQIVFLFYEGMTALDAIGPHEILCRLPGAIIQRAALRTGSVCTDSAGLQMTAEYSLDEISHADVLVIPGAGTATTLRCHHEILSWIKMIHETTTWTSSICTGSLILGAAGLLSGIKATTHWAGLNRLTHWNAIPIKKRIVEDGKVITAAGVSAGIDMALKLAEKIAGQRVAETLQLGIEYDPEPPFNSGSSTKAPAEILKALQMRFEECFEPL